MTDCDILIRNGNIYDGTGSAPVSADLAIRGDRIVVIDARTQFRARSEIEARGLAVAPGFINMLSWAGEALLHDGRSQSDIRQGVTLEVMGEGWSMGPLNAALKQEQLEQQGDVKYDINWSTLGEYLDYVTERGVSCNVASFVGATPLRIHELGHAHRRATPAEL